MYKCRIGKNCKIDSFVYVEEGVVIGDNCKIRPFVFIPTGVKIEDNVFVGPNVTFTNDQYPKVKGDWKLIETSVRQGAAIGANSVVLPGVAIGKNALIGAGCVVTKDVPDVSVLLALVISLIGSAALFLLIGSLKYLSTFMPAWMAWGIMGLTSAA